MPHRAHVGIKAAASGELPYTWRATVPSEMDPMMVKRVAGAEFGLSVQLAANGLAKRLEHFRSCNRSGHE
jgi:muconolactone delta-isomerase